MLDIKIYSYDDKLVYQAFITKDNMAHVCGAIQEAVCTFDEPTQKLIDNLREINRLLGIDNAVLATKNTELESIIG